MIFRLAWKNVWRNRLRSGIMVAAIVFGLLGVILMVGFVRAMTASMIENVIKYQTSYIQVHTTDFLLNEELTAWIPDAEGIASEIRKLHDVTAVALRQVVDGMMASATTSRGVRINGVDLEDEVRVTAVADNVVKGRWLPEEGRNPILVSQRSGKKLNLRTGSKVVLTFSDLEGEVSGAAFRVSGFYETPSSSFDEGNVFVRKGDLMHYTGLKRFHEISIRIKNENILEDIKIAISHIVGNRGKVQDWSEVQPLLSALTGTMNLMNNIVIIVFVVALGFGIVNIMLMSVFERSREFGMLKAVGMTGSKVLRLVLLESLFLGGVGGLIGLLASSLLITITGRIGLPFGYVAEGMGVMGVDTILFPEVPFSIYMATFIMVLFTSLMAALYPARQVLKKNISAALMEKN